jgi:hypothetical protein
VNDGTGEPAHQRHALGLQKLANVLPIELAQPLRHLAHHAEGKLRRTVEHRDHGVARDLVNSGFHFCHGGGRTRLIIDDRQFAKHIAWGHAGKNLPLARPDDGRDLHLSAADNVERVPSIAFFEDLRAAGETQFASHAFERRQLVGRERTEQFTGLQWEHGQSVGEEM